MAILATQLRIGSKVKHLGIEHTIDSPRAYPVGTEPKVYLKLVPTPVPLKELEPIRLTREVIQKYGFYHDPADGRGWLWKRGEDKGVRIKLTESTLNVFTFSPLSLTISALHDLQDLFLLCEQKELIP